MSRRWPGWLVSPWTPQLLAVRNRSLDIIVTAAVTDANFSGNPALRCAACGGHKSSLRYVDRGLRQIQDRCSGRGSDRPMSRILSWPGEGQPTDLIV